MTNNIDTPKYYPEMSGEPVANIASVSNCLDRISTGNEKEDKSNLLKDMWILWDREVPIFINNYAGTWINPFFAFKMFWQTGLPIEMLIDNISKHIKEDAGKYWYEWCDFWLDTFIKGDIKKIKENFICN